MNFKIMLIAVIAGIGVASYGVLSNDLALDIQKFDLVVLPPMDGSTIEGATEFSTVQCACSDPDNLDSGIFSPDNCDVTWIVDPAGPDGEKGTEDDVVGVPDPNSLGTTGNTLCTWEASASVYGSALDYDEGCSANYWLKNSDPASADYSWPSGYSPDIMYEDIFHIALVKDVSEEKKIEKLKEKIQRYKTKITELQDKGQIKSKTGNSLRWLLDAIPTGDDDSAIASDKLEKFYDRLNLFVDRKILYPIDKQYILEFDNESQENEHHKFTLLDALSNNFLNPSDKQIAKQSVAAILNAAHFQVSYHYSVPEIMLMTQDGITNDNQIKTANEFKKHNLAGASPICPSNDD